MEGRRPVALIMDDYPDTREMYVEVFSSGGFQVVSAATPEEARERIGWRVPDIVIADMNCGTGLAALLQEIGAIPPLRTDIPVILVGADLHPDSGHLHALARRPVAMGKPCLPDALLLQACRLIGIEPPRG